MAKRFKVFHRTEAVVALLLIVTTTAVYWPLGRHDFVGIDDDWYVMGNPQVRAGLTTEGVIWAFTTLHAGNWHPLTWLSHMLDCQLFGLTPGMHHLTSLLFHLANSLLLFILFRRMTQELWPSAFVAVLFALHPLHVESVAWATERKDVLSTFFGLLTMLAYTHYCEQRTTKRYVLTFVAFVSMLMSKPMLVTLPFVLLLVDYWPLRRLDLGQSNSRGAKSNFEKASVSLLLREKIVFFALSAILSLVTLAAQQKWALVAPLDAVPLNMRIANALVSYVSYIGKMIWPGHLAVRYPLPETIPVWKSVGAGFFLVILSAVFVWTRRRFPYFIVGWLWFLGTLVPVIGIVHMGGLAMADHYTYVPLIGLFIIIAWGMQDLVGPWRYRRILLSTLTGTLVIALMVCASFQVRYWKNTISLERRAVQVTDDYKAHYNLGLALMTEGNLEEAIAHYSRALEIKPDYTFALNNLGLALMRQGKLDDAIDSYAEALKIDPNYPEAHYNLGLAFMRQGKLDGAISQYRKALQIRPDYLRARRALGIALRHRRQQWYEEGP
jgi:tetratricopeptide (TPR) repeat protein